MPEKFPTPESNQEFNEAELALIKRLEVLTPGSPEMMAALQAWNVEQEALAEAKEVNTSPDETYRAGFKKEIQKAKIYRAAGLLQDAWDTLNAIQTMARNQDDQTGFEEAGRMMDEIKREGNEGV